MTVEYLLLPGVRVGVMGSIPVSGDIFPVHLFTTKMYKLCHVFLVDQLDIQHCKIKRDVKARNVYKLTLFVYFPRFKKVALRLICQFVDESKVKTIYLS
jgi:hypothetical protein